MFDSVTEQYFAVHYLEVGLRTARKLRTLLLSTRCASQFFLITALASVLVCYVSYNYLNHATIAAAGHCRKRHHQKMSSVTFPRTIEQCSGTGTIACQPRFSCSPPDHWKKTFLRGIKLAASIVHGALSRVATNAYLAQASLPKAEALLSVVDTSLSASVWNLENSFQRLYYALSSGFKSLIAGLLSLEILLCFKIFKNCVSKLCQNGVFRFWCITKQFFMYGTQDSLKYIVSACDH